MLAFRLYTQEQSRGYCHLGKSIYNSIATLDYLRASLSSGLADLHSPGACYHPFRLYIYLERPKSKRLSRYRRLPVTEPALPLRGLELVYTYI